MARSPDSTRSFATRLTRQIRRTAKTPDAGQVHNLRVVIRRFNQAVKLFSPRVRAVQTIRARLKVTMKLAGAVRDADIAAKLVARLRPTGVNALRIRLDRRRMEAERLLLESLHAWIATPLPTLKIDASSVDKSVITRAGKRLFERGAKAKDPKRLHRLRIAAKKLRYTMELLAPQAPVLSQIKHLQSLLGDINDCRTACEILETESGGKQLIRELEQQQRRMIREFRQYWKTNFDGRANVRSWMQELANAA